MRTISIEDRDGDRIEFRATGGGGPVYVSVNDGGESAISDRDDSEAVVAFLRGVFPPHGEGSC